MDLPRCAAWRRISGSCSCSADKLGKVDQRWYVRLPAVAWLITAPSFAAAMLLPVDLWVIWLLLLVPNALNILWLGPVATAVQHLVPASMRATASGSFLMINNLIGLGVGPTLMGWLSDRLTAGHGIEALRIALVACLGFYLLAALLMFVAARTIRKDWVAES